LPFLLIIPTDHITFICFLPHKLLQLSRGLLKEYVPWWATDGSARPIERLSAVVEVRKRRLVSVAKANGNGDENYEKEELANSHRQSDESS